MAMIPEKHEFFESMGHLGLTYGDVRTVPGPMDPAAPDVPWQEFFEQPPLPDPDISSEAIRGVRLATPLISAAMDRVTERHMAIAMAKLGGLGVIHCAMGVDEQKKEAAAVKRNLNGLIEDPVSFLPDQSIRSVLEERENRKYDYWTFLVADEEQRLVGLLTELDFRFAKDDLDQPVSTIMTPFEDVTYAPAGIDQREAYATMAQHKKKMLPLVDDQRRVAGLYVLSDVERILAGNPENYSLDASGSLLCAIAVPTSLGALERIEACRRYIDVVVIDSAHGDSPYALKTYEMIREVAPELKVVSPNISSAEASRLWAERGVDAIKVGQGGGSICTTRIETGIGIPQITAVYQCAAEAEKFNVPVTADGGVSKNGDLTVATAAGAHAVMLGNMLAGTEEAPGEDEWVDGRRVKEYRGMGSDSVFMERPEARSRYSADPTKKPLAEGVSGFVPYKGKAERIVADMVKGLRQGLRYSGRRSLDEHREKTMLMMGTGNALNEARPHDII